MHGKHFPPKYAIGLAHRLATGESLSLDRYSGGAESNRFLRSRGFSVVECECGGGDHEHSATTVSAPSEWKQRKSVSTRLKIPSSYT